MTMRRKSSERTYRKSNSAPLIRRKSITTIITTPSSNNRIARSSKTFSRYFVFIFILLIVLGLSFLLGNLSDGSSSRQLFGMKYDAFLWAFPRMTTIVSQQSNDINHYNNATTTTLALLYPPGLIGGYRNQVMRFIAFCVYAQNHGHEQLLLPSLLWTTEIHNNNNHDNPNLRGQQQHNDFPWFPIPFAWIFDVEYWNTFQPHLPKLIHRIHTTTKRSSDCWMEPTELPGYQQLLDGKHKIPANNKNNMQYYQYYPTTTEPGPNNTTIILNHLQRIALLQGTIRPVSNISIPRITRQLITNSRKEDYLPWVQHCTNPFVYGGGTKGGKLWNDFLRFRRDASPQQQQSGSVVPHQTDVWVYRALRPAQQWRDLAEQCIQSATKNGRYVALHARVELEMMNHPCGASMEKNLTKIVQNVHDLHETIVEKSNGTPASGLFLAVSRDGMMIKNSAKTHKLLQKYAKENLRTLDLLVSNQSEDVLGVRKYELPVFECGKRALMDYYAQNPHVPNHGSLLESVINFHIAVSADIFVGVKGSSFSNDVWTTRYWQGKGNTNYQYTLSGIQEIENGGLPEPHGNCQRKKPKS